MTQESEKKLVDSLILKLKKQECMEEEQRLAIMKTYVKKMEQSTSEEQDFFEKLETHVKKIFSYHMFSGYSPEVSFEYGFLYGLLSLKESFVKSKISQQKIKTIEVAYRKYAGILQCIRENPGITHDELVRKTNIKKSRLSQVMGALKDDDIVTCIKVGRYKLYYLDNIGIQLCEKYNANNKKTNEQLDSPYICLLMNDINPYEYANINRVNTKDDRIYKTNCIPVTIPVKRNSRLHMSSKLYSNNVG